MILKFLHDVNNTKKECYYLSRYLPVWNAYIIYSLIFYIYYNIIYLWAATPSFFNSNAIPLKMYTCRYIYKGEYIQLTIYLSTYYIYFQQNKVILLLLPSKSLRQISNTQHIATRLKPQQHNAMNNWLGRWENDSKTSLNTSGNPQ